MKWLRWFFGVSRTERERPIWSDGTPRTRIVNDGMSRLTLVKGLAPGRQPCPGDEPTPKRTR